MIRSRRRVWRRMVLALAALAIIFGLLVRLLFVVRNVEIVGDTGSYSADSIVRIANVGFGESIFRVDEEQIAARINSTGSLSAQKVRLRYPDTVEIEVKQRRRVAMALHMGKIHVLDAQGYVVESLSQVPNEDLIYVSGMRVQGHDRGEQIRADEEQLQAYQASIGAILRQSAGMYISELKMDDAQEICIITRTGVSVELGNSENMDNKIAWMKSAVADLERRGETGGTLDVRSGARADYRQSS